MTESEALDLLAEILREPDWNPAADYLDRIADVVRQVRNIDEPEEAETSPLTLLEAARTLRDLAGGEPDPEWHPIAKRAWDEAMEAIRKAEGGE